MKVSTGSSLHAMKLFANPRWEDFEYEYVNDNPNGWIGDGWAYDEKNNIISVDYLDDDQVDFPPVAASIDDVGSNGKLAEANGSEAVVMVSEKTEANGSH
jgi:hypothetical protein